MIRFQEIEEVRTENPDSVDYTLLLPGHRYTAPPPEFMYGDVSARLNSLLFGRGFINPVGYYGIKNAKICRENMAILGETLLTSVSTNYPEHHCRHVMANVDLDALAAPRRIDGTLISLVGPGWDNWGHWLVDFLPRIYLMTHHVSIPGSIRYLVPGNIRPFAVELLRIVGVQPQSLVFYEPAEVVQVERLLVPQNLTAGGMIHPAFRQVTRWLRSMAFDRPELPRSDIRRVYISRSSHPNVRRLINRPEIEDLASRYGYKIVDPTGLTVLEQIALFRGATILAGEYGSGLHSSLFSSSRSVVTCIRGDGEAAGFLQAGVVRARRQALGYVFGHHQLGEQLEPFSVDLHHAEQGFAHAEEVAQNRWDE